MESRVIGSLNSIDSIGLKDSQLAVNPCNFQSAQRLSMKCTEVSYTSLFYKSNTKLLSLNFITKLITFL